MRQINRNLGESSQGGVAEHLEGKCNLENIEFLQTASPRSYCKAQQKGRENEECLERCGWIKSKIGRGTEILFSGNFNCFNDSEIFSQKNHLFHKQAIQILFNTMGGVEFSVSDTKVYDPTLLALRALEWPLNNKFKLMQRILERSEIRRVSVEYINERDAIQWI